MRGAEIKKKKLGCAVASLSVWSHCCEISHSLDLLGHLVSREVYSQIVMFPRREVIIFPLIQLCCTSEQAVCWHNGKSVGFGVSVT